MTATTFPPDVVEAVCRHMNDDHAADALLICRTLGGRPEAERVVTDGFDSEAMHFTVWSGEQADAVSVPFDEPVLERPQVRLAVVRLHEKACDAAGLARREH